MSAHEPREAHPVADGAATILIFLWNAFVCRELFHAEYIDAFSSVEGSFIALSRWILANPHDVAWLPYWFGGMPWLDVYQPGFHSAVAGIAALCRTSPPLVYHALNGFAYCLGPVTFFWMCRTLTGSRGYAFLAALLYSTFSASVLFPLVFHDLGGAFRSRRLQEITNYGEGPHLAVLALLPLVILLIHRACRERSRFAMAAGPVALAACLLMNWTGTVGVAMALLAYAAVYVRSASAWVRAGSTAVLAYGLSSPWIPPATLRRVVIAAQQANGNYPFLRAHTAIAFAFLAVIVLLVWLFRRTNLPEFLQFSLLLGLLPATVFCAWSIWGFAVLPQPFRWHLEFELGATATLVFLGWRVTSSRARLQAALAAALVLFCTVQLFVYREYARVKIQPVSIEKTPGYQIAKWFETHLPGERVFAPGSISLWMNAFTDNPQFAGCCDQGVSNRQLRAALYAIYTGQNAGDHDAENSVLWLKAFGVQAVETSGPGSGEIFHPFQRPAKFDGVLPLLWRRGGDSIYAIPQRTTSLAHVVYPSSLVKRAPANGIDGAPLLPYVKALDDPSLPLADFQWTSRHSARVRATLRSGQVISIQESYDPGWRGRANGTPATISADELGLMVVDPHCIGECVLDIDYAHGPARTVAAVLATASAVLLMVAAIAV